MSAYIPGRYLMNNIPRGTTPYALLCSLADLWRIHPGSRLCYEFILQIMENPIIQDSQLDDELSVAIIEFKFGQTPTWFKMLDRDPNAFPKVTALGTLWGGVDLTSVDDKIQTPFCRAVIGGELVYAETLAEFAETDVNRQDSHGWTALHWACANKLAEMTDFLLTVPKIDTGLTDANGLTAFDISCVNDDQSGEVHENEVIQHIFYKSMFEMDKTDPDGALLRLLTVTSEPDEDGAVFPGEALFSPVVKNNQQLVKALMDSGVDLSSTNEDRETALHLAAKEGHTAIVNTLLVNSSRGNRVDLEAIAKDGHTALHYAAAGGHHQTVEELLVRGADHKAKDNIGRTPLDRAVQNRHAVIQQILNDKENSGGVRPGVVVTPSQVVEETLNPTNDLELNKLKNLNIALRRAAREARTELLKTLLDQGSDIEGQNEKGETALQLASSSGHYEIVRLLLNSGADVEANALCSWSPLHSAAFGNHHTTVQLLLDKGANIEAELADLGTALYMAASGGHLATVQLLLDKGANTEPSTPETVSALRIAATNGHRATVQLLLVSGANLMTKTGEENTWLLRAASGYRKELAQLFKDSDGFPRGRYRPSALYRAMVSSPFLILMFLRLFLAHT